MAKKQKVNKTQAVRDYANQRRAITMAVTSLSRRTPSAGWKRIPFCTNWVMPPTLRRAIQANRQSGGRFRGSRRGINAAVSTRRIVV